MTVVNRLERETPGRRFCAFCEWSLTVTEVDLRGDTLDAFDRHLKRHAQALTVEDAERVIFGTIVQQLIPQT